MVNRAVKDLVISTAGSEGWRQVRERAGLEVDEFVAMDPYDDAITYDLVGAASDVLDTPAHEILEAFGRHWILYTGAEGWGPVLDLQGSTVAEIVDNLDNMHHRIKATMPSLVMPRFAVTHRDATLIEVEYRSERVGLAPMVIGLLKGMAERCNETWDVAHTGTKDTNGYDSFTLTSPASSHPPLS